MIGTDVYKRQLLDIGRGADGADNDDRQLPQEGIGIGVCHVELVGTGHRLFVWGDGLESHIPEHGFAAVEQQVKPGTAVSHVGEPVASGVVGHIAAAGIDDPYHSKPAGSGVCQDPVSYIHLDVYKRQDRGDRSGICNRRHRRRDQCL